MSTPETSRPAVDHAAVAESINAQVHYTLYAVYGAIPTGPGFDADALAGALAGIDGLHTRGWYDVSGFRAGADALAWWWAEDAETLQKAHRTVVEHTRGTLGQVWNGMGVHRAAEFNRGHVPAFLAGDEPRRAFCLYPFVRSYEWYLLPEDERRELLREHGYAARDYRDVLANTTSSFALGDYEWLLAFEGDEMVRLVDLMRELRATGARRHVREETPFFTGFRAEDSRAFLAGLGAR